MMGYSYDRRVATRPIPLDKPAVQKLAADLAEKLAAYAKRQPQDMPLGHDSRVLDLEWKTKTVKGDDLRILVVLFSVPSSSPSLVTGAHVQEADLLDDAHIKLGIRLNGSRPFGDFTDAEHEGSNGLRYQFYQELIHELTHAAEWYYLPHKPKQEEDILKGGPAADAYYNAPHEVRAFMQQIVEQIMPKARGFKRNVPHRDTHDYVLKLLNTSAKWKQVRPHLNAKNEALILKAVYNALDAAGLV